MIENYLIKSGNHKIDLHTNAVENPQKIILCLHGFNGDLWGDGFNKIRRAVDNILICSFDSAGHGNSEVQSLDMRLELINKEIYDVVNHLVKKYPKAKIIVFAGSYGAYRTITTLANYDLQNVEHIVFVNPAFNMIEILQRLKEFDYFKLDESSVVPMKQSLNKYLSKKFLDDLYKNDAYTLKFTPIPMTIFIGTQDSLIPRRDTLKFLENHKCFVKYIEDEHGIEKPENWQQIIEYLKQL